VILKVVTTNICGSDQQMVRGRTTAPAGMVLGHEITGKVIEKGRDVEYLDIGDLVSVPFNVACGRCRTCREGDTGVCLHVNSERAGGAYGYVDMGGWIGGQADYVMVPYADFNLLKFPDRERAMEKIRDLTCLSDILPPDFTEPSPPRSASGRRSTSPARGRSDLRPRHPRASLARPKC
jgi:glutathione-independent formaldehyde dehydrogenase